MEIVRLGVVEGPSEYSQDAVLEVVLQPSGMEGLHRHRLTAFFEMAVSTVRAFRAPSTLQDGAHRMAPSWQRSPQELMAFAISSLHRAAGLDLESCEAREEGSQWRIIIRPAGSRATRRAVELAVTAFADFSEGRSVDLRQSVVEVRRIAAEGRPPAPRQFPY